jgi:hypothetical protein
MTLHQIPWITPDTWITCTGEELLFVNSELGVSILSAITLTQHEIIKNITYVSISIPCILQMICYGS